MPSYIPFVNSRLECQIVHELYADAPVLRISLQRIGDLGDLPQKPQLWLDPSADVLHHPRQTLSESWWKYLCQFPHADRLFSPEFLAKPDRSVVREFVRGMLEECVKHRPAWITVPQIPVTDDSSRNKINRTLAEAAGDWKRSGAFKGKLILPLVFTHARQVTYKTRRDDKVRLALDWCGKADAEGIWTVDSTLNDQEGSGPLDKRFGKLIELQRDLFAEAGHHLILVGGPYWGMNLVLWSRGLLTHAAIGLGSSYQYRVPGRKGGRQRAVRIALPPLRRWARSSGQLRDWLREALKRLSPNDRAHKDLVALHSQYDATWDEDRGKKQVAAFYKRWYDLLDGVPSTGRALALYQDLSSAFVVGKALPPLPPTEQTARRPEIVAQQLMLKCL